MSNTLVESRLPRDQIDRRLTREDEALHAGLDVDHAWDMLLRIDDVARRLHEADETDVNRACRQALDSARVQFLDDLAVNVTKGEPEALNLELVGTESTVRQSLKKDPDGVWRLTLRGLASEKGFEKGVDRFKNDPTKALSGTVTVLSTTAYGNP